ncbi:type-2 ice-structuring protein-like isoform X1 [Epinephelus lanceolatus]
MQRLLSLCWTGSAEDTDTPKRRREESAAAVIVTMKMLIVSALVCAMMVLTRAAAPPEETPQDETAPPEETPQDETESRLVKRSTACPWGWSLLGGRCYRYVPTLMTWARAERNCQALGGNLASVHNIQEYFNIQRLISQVTYHSHPAWIGGSDAQEESEWFWSDGTPFHYQKWCHGEPNNRGGREHCLQMNHAADKCWNDLPCFSQLPYVCAMDSK